MGINSSNEIYLYDPQTKKLLKEFTSQRLAERELGLYRGAISDYLRKGINRSKVRTWLSLFFNPSDF